MGRFAMVLPVCVVASILEVRRAIRYVPTRESLVVLVVQLTIKEVNLGDVLWLDVVDTKHFSLWICCVIVADVKACSCLRAVIPKQFKKLGDALPRLEGLTAHTAVGRVRRVEADVFLPEQVVP